MTLNPTETPKTEKTDQKKMQLLKQKHTSNRRPSPKGKHDIMNKKFAGIPLNKKIIMGILNLSPKTFYKGSLAKNSEEAGKKAKQMVENGAQIIDIGAMSTGPGVKPIPIEKEKNLLIPTIKAVQKKISKPISVDTQRSEIAKQALETGASIINDISGFKADEKMPKVAAEHDCYGILMANKIPGRLRTAEKEKKDIESMEKVKQGLKDSLKICEDENVDLEKMAIDPGIGFGRGAEEDLEILSNLDELKKLGQPICLGVSRKSFIGKTLDIDGPSERLPGSLGANAVGVMKSAVDIIRTHDPKETSQFVRIIEAIQNLEVGG